MNYTELKQRFGPYQFYALSLVILFLTGYLAFSFGYKLSDEQQTLLKQLKNSSESLRLENADLSRQVNVMSVELDIATTTQRKLAEETELALAREVSLRKELGFYQQVHVAHILVTY